MTDTESTLCPANMGDAENSRCFKMLQNCAFRGKKYPL